MNRALVDLFFLHIVFANLLVGGRLVSSHDQVLHRFGMGVTLTGLAYIAWALAAIIRPTNLDAWVAVGVVPLMAAFIVLFSSWLMLQPKKWRVPALVVAGLAAIAFFVIRTFVLPSHPYFSSEGLFFFNPDPTVKVLYIVAIAIVAFPAIERAASRLDLRGGGPLFKALFLAVALCSVVLLASDNATVLQINGWALSGVLLVLWVRFGVRGVGAAAKPA
jgi:hypothetical protein